MSMSIMVNDHSGLRCRSQSTPKPGERPKTALYGPRGGYGYDSATSARPMRWARWRRYKCRDPADNRVWTSTITYGCAPGWCSCSGRSATRAGRTRTRSQRGCGRHRMIGWSGVAPCARPRDRASDARHAGRPWRARLPRPSAPIPQRSVLPSMMRSAPSGSGKGSSRYFGRGQGSRAGKQLPFDVGKAVTDSPAYSGARRSATECHPCGRRSPAPRPPLGLEW